MSIKTFSFILLGSILLTSCGMSKRQAGGFSESELALIHGADCIMRVLTIDDPEDLTVLRSVSYDLPDPALASPEFARLAELMVETVTHPSQDGVGIAGPQVGLNRRVVAVQRFDKEGEPFEVYPNIRIIWASDSLASGPEGCLSVPDRRGDVMRSQVIVIEYSDITGMRSSDGEPAPKMDTISTSARTAHDHYKTETAIPIVRDTVRGFTAVIFQHEVDHLDGILYIDRLD